MFVCQAPPIMYVCVSLTDASCQTTIQLMHDDNRLSIGNVLRQQRLSLSLTVREIAEQAAVSTSLITRIEKGTRFPSVGVLKRIAKPLLFDEQELITLAGYRSPSKPRSETVTESGRLDPYVAAILAEDPVEVQRAAVSILVVLKNIAEAGIMKGVGGKGKSSLDQDC